MMSEDSLKEITRNIAKYPADQKQSAVMAALAVAQDDYGWLSAEAIAEVATLLEMPAIGVQEVATFYNMYNVTPTGHYKLAVCTNLPCELSGGKRAAEYIKQKLSIDFGQTTKCGTFTLVEGECMGACGDAPVLLMNNKTMCSWMTNEKIDIFLQELTEKKKVIQT